MNPSTISPSATSTTPCPFPSLPSLPTSSRQSLQYHRSSASPNAWAELETGQLRTDKLFYDRWTRDLSSQRAWEKYHRMKGLQVKEGPPRIDAETLLRRMIIPKEGGKLIPETFIALKKLKENGIITCGLTNNFVPFLPIARYLSVPIL